METREWKTIKEYQDILFDLRGWLHCTKFALNNHGKQ